MNANKLDKYRDSHGSLVTLGIVAVFALMVGIAVVDVIANLYLAAADVFQGRL